jgi:hypothetical protein
VKDRNYVDYGLILGLVLVVGIAASRPILCYQRYGWDGLVYFVINGRSPVEVAR